MREPILRFVIVYAVLTGTLYAVGDGYSAAWSGPIEIVLTALPSPVAVQSVDTGSPDGTRVFHMTALTRDRISTPRGEVPAGVRIDATTLQAYAHHHAILILAALIAWPVRRSTQRFALLAAALPAIFAATLLDIPFVLAGLARETILAASDPQALRSDPGILYFELLQRGGRQALALVSAGLAIVLVTKASPATSIIAAHR